MSGIKKEVILYILFLLFLISVSTIYAQSEQLGCCANPGAGLLACSSERLALSKECCPKPETDYASYYKSEQNPNAPTNYDNCATNFFFPNTACSIVDACSLGCCCSELGGSLKPEAQCKGTGVTFYKGQTNCNALCPTPQCNDGIDNDNNGCADFEGGDLGCTSPADNTESGGSCAVEGVGCSNANYIPKLSNLQITPVKGQRKFLLTWNDECSATAVSYDILRCKGDACANFAIIGTTNKNSFEDSSSDLLFDTTYTYQIKARYNLQTALPTITKTSNLGNIECLEQFSSNNFCIHQSYYIKYQNYLSASFPDKFKNFADGVENEFSDKFNKAYFCDSFNKLLPEGTSCSSNQQFCVVNNNKPSCANKVNCNYNAANPFGLYYTLQDCETNRYCFYDRSHSTINSCFSCNPSMACYDYKTEEACARDNCKIENCKWKGLANQIGIGVCVSLTDYNCQWCDKKGTSTLENLRAFNEVFDLCTKEKSNTLSEGQFKCYFSNGMAKNCNEVRCKDYDASQCSNVQITHDENNKIKNPSQDECSIGVCQNTNNVCVKNADGDNKADCSNEACESDYFAPNTTLLTITRKGIADSIVVQIYDKTSINSSVTLRTSLDYLTFLCVEPCGSDGHPYDTSTNSRTMIISNLNAFDGGNGNKLLTLNEGTNAIRYYSQDLSKNIGEVKKITIEAHSNTDGPKVFVINISDATRILDRYYTSNQQPTIEVQFLEPAIVTHSRLVNRKTGLIVNLQGNTELSAKATFTVPQVLPNGEYTFELNAKDKNNIFMDPQLSVSIAIDNIQPTLDIIPSNGSLFNASLIQIKLTFNKEVNLEDVKINSQDIKGLFSTINNKEFTASLNLSDGNKKLEVTAKDFAKNQVSGSSLFIVDANPTIINIINPKFGTASKSIFDIVVETDNDAVCRYSLDNNFEFEFMEPFGITSGATHTISNFNKIASGDTNTHKLNVRCKAQRGLVFKAFDINVDTTPPQIKSAFAYPNPVVEKPSTTKLTVEADEPVICKFSSNTKEFDNMEGKFEGYDNNTFKVINKQEINVENEGNYLYYVACKNKAELNSSTKEIQFKVDLTVPISIVSHTPEYFNSTNVVLAIETNKKSQCKFSETDNTAQSGEIFGAPGYSHTRQLITIVGKHTFYVVCKDQYLQKFSDVKAITFAIDTTPPIILSVDDNSTLADKPEFTWNTDYLRVKWYTIDDESKVSSHLYSLVESGTANAVITWATSYANNEWVIVNNANGTILNLLNGNSYFFRVRAKNIVGLLSEVKESNGVTVDVSLKPLNCTNGVKDNKETDVDCGNGCALCDSGKKCGVNVDCKSNFCANGLCTAPKCDDNVKNQDESDIDCGWQCKKCQNSKSCNSNNDCESGYCTFGTCKPQESCLDGKLSPGESDLDCGGPCPIKCSEGRQCDSSNDCGEGLKCHSDICKKCEENDENCNGIPDDQEGKGIKDTDNDGIPDDWELQNGLNPNDASDANLDSDNDGLTNIEEFKVQVTFGKSTDPNKADTDGDGFNDREEIDRGTNPVDSQSFPKSKLGNIILFIFGIAVLLSGLGYLTYRLAKKRQEEKFKFTMQKEIKPVPKQPKIQAPQILQKQKEEELRVREALKHREELKQKEREKLFGAFGEEKQKEIAKEQVEEKKPSKQIKKEKESKPREEVFTKLAKIAKEEKSKKISAKPKKQYKVEKLYDLAKSTKKTKK